jgi:hypothetical protein
MMLIILGVFYGTKVFTCYVIEFLIGALGLIPEERNAKVMTEGITWNYTTWLNIVFVTLAVALVIRFLRTGGLQMLAMMNGSPEEMTHEH